MGGRVLHRIVVAIFAIVYGVLTGVEIPWNAITYKSHPLVLAWFVGVLGHDR